MKPFKDKWPGRTLQASLEDANPFVAISAEGPWTPINAAETKNDVLVQRFKKELMRVGRYRNPDDTMFEITLADLHHWVGVSKQMHKNGVRIPVSMGPRPHLDVGDPNNSIGTLEDEFVEGDGLFVILEIVGEENIKQALANDVSIFSPVEYTDGEGRVYQRPITHVAITPNPLVPDLEGWEIAASLEASNGGKENGMWKKIAKALGVPSEGLTEENAESKILAAIKKSNSDHKEALKAAKKGATKASLEDGGELREEFDAEVLSEVDRQMVTKTAEIRASISGNTEDPDPMMVDVVADNRGLKLDGLFEGCRITTDVQKDIRARYGEKTAIAASMKLGQNGDEFKFWMGILAKNDPVTLVEKSGAQVTKASLPDPNTGDVTPDEKNPLLIGAQKMADDAAAKK